MAVETKPEGRPRGPLERVIDVGRDVQRITVPVEIGMIGVGLLAPPLAPLALWGTAGLAIDGTTAYAADALETDMNRVYTRRGGGHLEKSKRNDSSNKMKVEASGTKSGGGKPYPRRG